MKKKVTSKDVAQRANVSSATVSYVLNNVKNKHISESTRQRVIDAAVELNYVPNSAAKRLKTNYSNCVAVRLVTTLTSDRYYSTLQGIRSYLEPQGYNILLCNDQRNGNSYNYIDACMGGQADGIIYIAANNAEISPDALALIRKNNIPISAIDCMANDETISSVTYDYFASSYKRVEWALEKGFKNFIYMRPSYKNEKEDKREMGFRASLFGNEELNFNVYYFDSQDSNKSAYETNNSSNNNMILKKSFVKELVYNADCDSCFICNNHQLQQTVSQLLHNQYLMNPCTKSEKWYERSISYRYPHQSAGFEAARSLLDEINGDKEIRKLTLQPILEPTDPEDF